MANRIDHDSGVAYPIIAIGGLIVMVAFIAMVLPMVFNMFGTVMNSLIDTGGVSIQTHNAFTFTTGFLNAIPILGVLGALFGMVVIAIRMRTEGE